MLIEICTNVVSGVATCVWTLQLTCVEMRFYCKLLQFCCSYYFTLKTSGNNGQLLSLDCF